MHIELIDLLRCPREHEETWLVAALNAVQDRYVIKAKLGCPVCGATYFIRNGIADLRQEESVTSGDESISSGTDAAMRIAAFLNLTRPGSLVALEGRYANLARAISEMTECRVIALNPSSPLDDSEQAASVLCDSRFPLATASLDGIALSQDKLIADVARVLKSWGRVVVGAATNLPAGLMEIARDENAIIAESIGTIVPLRR